jgi:hypothetical protein
LNGENNSGAPKAYAGRFSASGGNITTGIMDGMRVDQTGDNGGPFTGSYVAPNATTGRFTMTLTPTGSTESVTMVVYIIDAKRMFMLETAGDTGLLAGEMRTQLQSSYSAASLNAPFVLYSQGYEYSNNAVSGYDSQVFEGIGNGTGGMTIRQSYQDADGTLKTGKENGGPIAVTFDATYPGRVTFPAGKDSGFLYFFDKNSAFELDFNGSDGYLESGWVEAQSQTTFTNAAIAGTYMLGKLPPMEPNNDDVAGEFTLSSSSTGGITGGITSAGEGEFSWDQSMTMSYIWDASTVNTGTFTIGNGDKGLSCAVISATKAVCIVNGSSSAETMILQK